MPRLNAIRVREVLKDIHYKGWKFVVLCKGDGFLLQLRWMAPDADTKRMAPQSSRKWYISSHAIPQEVVRTAWKAVLAAEEHEAGESFTYKGCRIFNPHQDPDDLIEVSTKKRPD